MLMKKRSSRFFSSGQRERRKINNKSASPLINIYCMRARCVVVHDTTFWRCNHSPKKRREKEKKRTQIFSPFSLSFSFCCPSKRVRPDEFLTFSSFLFLSSFNLPRMHCEKLLIASPFSFFLSSRFRICPFFNHELDLILT